MSDQACALCCLTNKAYASDTKEDVLCIQCFGKQIPIGKHNTCSVDENLASLLKQKLNVSDHMNCGYCGVYTNMYFTVPLCAGHRSWSIRFVKSLENVFGDVPVTKIQVLSQEEFARIDPLAVDKLLGLTPK